MIENILTQTLDIFATHIIFISDIHFGVRRNSEEWQDNLKNYFYNFFIPKVIEIKSSLGENEKLICINLGDTYEDRKSIDIDVSNLAIDIFEDIAKEVEVYVINGNHDLSKRTNTGNTSLRSIEYLPNIHVITNPTLLNINYQNNKHTKFITIPYLGSSEEETKYLIQYSGKVKYALMHTDVMKMKFDNGMLITKGVDADIFKGRIFSGHIHHRQETKKVVYVGSPYHTSKGDINDKKGLYVLSLKDNNLTFIENTYSPIYQIIQMNDYQNLSLQDRQTLMNNNYNFIVINEEDLPKVKKKFDIYNLGIGTTSKSAIPIIKTNKYEISVEEKTEYTEKTISELIEESIKQLDVDDNGQKRLIDLSRKYFKEAEAELTND